MTSGQDRGNGTLVLFFIFDVPNKISSSSETALWCPMSMLICLVKKSSQVLRYHVIKSKVFGCIQSWSVMYDLVTSLCQIRQCEEEWEFLHGLLISFLDTPALTRSRGTCMLICWAPRAPGSWVVCSPQKRRKCVIFGYGWRPSVSWMTRSRATKRMACSSDSDEDSTIDAPGPLSAQHTLPPAQPHLRNRKTQFE